MPQHKLRFAIPPGAGPGDTIQMKTPNGTAVKVTLPPGEERTTANFEEEENAIIRVDY